MEHTTDEIILCDEVFDARFLALLAAARATDRDRPQPSFDKQYVRDYLEEINFDKKPPGPASPLLRVVRGTTEKYLEAYRILTGKNLNITLPGYQVTGCGFQVL